MARTAAQGPDRNQPLEHRAQATLLKKEGIAFWKWLEDLYIGVASHSVIFQCP